MFSLVNPRDLLHCVPWQNLASGVECMNFLEVKAQSNGTSNFQICIATAFNNDLSNFAVNVQNGCIAKLLNNADGARNIGALGTFCNCYMFRANADFYVVAVLQISAAAIQFYLPC